MLRQPDSSQNVASYEELSEAVIGILRTYAKYEVPILRRVKRSDSQLFKYLLNHDFIRHFDAKHGVRGEGRKIYDAFEIDFQLDGHYWLQYGLYLESIGELEDALQMLRRSIQAFPDNQFAIHALADTQLRIARQRPTFDSVTRELISEAVTSLLREDARRMKEFDRYPMVTLAFQHVGALVKHQKLGDAKKAATQYFDRLQQLEKQTSEAEVTRAKDQIFRFLTLGVWVSR